jgi:hypothetical protein
MYIMTSVQRELCLLLDQMSSQQQQKLLEAARQILKTLPTFTGRELMALPAEERERLVAQARAATSQTESSINNDYNIVYQDDKLPMLS